MNRLWLLGAALAAWLGTGVAFAQPETAATADAELAGRLAQACRSLAASPEFKAAGRQEGLELFWLAELMAFQGEDFEARRIRRYLAAYWPRSPLLPMLPPVRRDGDLLSDFTPDPDWSRLVKACCLWLGPMPAAPDPADPELEAAVALSLAYLEGVSGNDLQASLAAFVREYPESRFAGWAVYQQAWAQWLEADGELAGFSALRAQYPDHPLAAEAAEAANVPYYNPRALAWRSSLLPGWGEELLEPGLRESSSQLYSELLFVAGAVGFAVASQKQSRQENLTGAAIFANLLFFNHQGSAEHVWQLAQRRNWAERNRFFRERLEAPIAGQGRFSPLEAPARIEPPLADELEVAWLLKLRGMDEGFRGRGWIHDDELMNMGWQVRWRRSFLQTPLAGPVAAGLAVAPRLAITYTQARTADPARFSDPLNSCEWSAGAELLGLVRWQLGGGWLQGSLGAGPVWRRRSLAFGPYGRADQGPALAASAGLEWGGQSGTFWQAGAWLEDDFRRLTLEADEGKVDVPGSSLGLQFSLGVRF